MLRLPWGGWCVSDPGAAEELLRGPEFNGGRSGFFGDLLPTRESQVAVGHAVRDELRSRLPEYRAALAREAALLPARSRWPEAATDLVHHALADLLLRPDSPAQLRALMNKAVHGGVLFQAPGVWQRAWAEILRARFIEALTEHIGQRHKDRSTRNRDVLDAVLGSVPEGLADRTAAEVFLLVFRSVVAPVSASLAWAVLLAATRQEGGGPLPWPADQVVREALRHRPMVWMVGRSCPHAAELAGRTIPAGEVVSVSPYLLHHDERVWPDPQEFRPERWSGPHRPGPYLPFGAGPFTCAGAAVAQELMAAALGALTGGGARITVTGGDLRPAMVEGAVPRPFTLHRTAP
ncbi:cytochrome P450 [Kitasatospora sp. NPDC006697]|uniref:cytochrome P450 n=1 Tax=Kitasatospora sp. NPDC006697 TaxID=3364020 RepID=UPI0036CB86C6